MQHILHRWPLWGSYWIWLFSTWIRCVQVSNLSLDSTSGEEVPSTSGEQQEQMCLLLIRVAMVPQPSNPFVLSHMTKISSHFLLLFHQVLHHQLSSWGVPCHAHILLSPPLHLLQLVYGQPPEPLGVLGLQNIFFVENFERKSVQVIKRVMRNIAWSSHRFDLPMKDGWLHLNFERLQNEVSFAKYNPVGRRDERNAQCLRSRTGNWLSAFLWILQLYYIEIEKCVSRPHVLHNTKEKLYTGIIKKSSHNISPGWMLHAEVA